jgi:hypothetical protein
VPLSSVCQENYASERLAAGIGYFDCDHGVMSFWDLETGLAFGQEFVLRKSTGIFQPQRVPIVPSLYHST